MKKIKLLLLSILFPAFMFSQGGVEVVPFAGFMFGGSVNYGYYYGGYNYTPKLDLQDGLNYGVSVLVPVQSLVDVEVNWTKMDKVTATFTNGGYSGYNDEEIYVSSNYFQIGGISKFYNGGNSVAQPFASFSLGATWFDVSPTPDSDPSISYDDVWKFSVALGLGVKIMFSERVGVMLRGRLLMPMTFSGAGFYVGTGGSGMTMGSWVSPLQGDFNGGLIIKLGGN
jgi:hypothetical protein